MFYALFSTERSTNHGSSQMSAICKILPFSFCYPFIQNSICKLLGDLFVSPTFTKRQECSIYSALLLDDLSQKFHLNISKVIICFFVILFPQDYLVTYMSSYIYDPFISLSLFTIDRYITDLQSSGVAKADIIYSLLIQRVHMKLLVTEKQ